MRKPIEISDRLFKILTTGSPEKKAVEIRNMTDNDPRFEELIRQLDDKEYVSRQIAGMNSYDTDSAWDAVARRAGIAGNRSHLRLPKRWISAAASIAVMLCVWLMRDNDITNPDNLITPELAMAINESEEKGITGARVENVALEKILAQAGRSKKQPGVTEPKAEPEKTFAEEILEAKRVTTFYNKEYWLTLPDGTVVHLARDTRFMYPEHFAADRREVYLEGEAYFIVAKNPDRRFIIHTGAGTATVYGTELNVSARTEDECKVVLVNGKAGVTADGGEERMLVPGEEAVIAGNGISVKEVDLAPYEAWNTGRIDFDSWPLRRVMSVLGRWYGKEIIFSDADADAIEISGNFDRYEDLMPTLESISSITGLSITVTDTSIEISKQ